MIRIFGLFRERELHSDLTCVCSIADFELAFEYSFAARQVNKPSRNGLFQLTAFVLSLLLVWLSPVYSTLQAQPTGERSTEPDPIREQLNQVSGNARIPLLIELAEVEKDDSLAVLATTAEALGLVDRDTNPVMKAKIRAQRSWALQATGKFAESRNEANRTIELLVDQDESVLLARAYYLMAVAEWRMSNNDQAMDYALKAREIQKALADPQHLSTTLTLLATIHRSLDNYEQAIAYHQQSLEIGEAQNDLNSIARSKNNIGLIYWELERYEDGYMLIEQALDHYRKAGLKCRAATCLSNLGLILIELGRPGESIELLNESLEIQSQCKDLVAKSKVLNNLGFAYEEMGEQEKALGYIRQSLKIREQIGDKRGIVRSSGSIANLYQEQGNHQEALPLLLKSYELAKLIGARSEQAALLKKMSKSREALGEYQKALVDFRQYHQLKTELSEAKAGQVLVALETRQAQQQREQEIRNLEHAVEARKAQIARQSMWQLRLLYGSLLLGACLILAIALYISRLRALKAIRATNQELRDTTERVVESEQRYRMLFETVDVPTMLFDDETNAILDLNLPARELCGSPPKSGTATVKDLEPDWLREVVGRVLKSDSSNDSSFEECWLERSGSRLCAEVRANSVLVDGKRAKLVNIRDTTKIRHQEEARIRADKLESIGLLAGGIAHDFNNVLTAILGYITLAKLRNADQTNDELNLAEQAALQASRLTTQLLTFSKGGEPVRRVHDVGQLLRQAVELAGSGSRMHIEVDIANNLWAAELDSGQLTQVISNLVINADQATSEGGMLEVSATNFQGDPQTNKQQHGDCFVRIDFIDNGSGISDEIREQVFDPYFTTKPDGNGLGLATAYAIATRHGGTISFESHEERGTRFSLFIPAVARANLIPNSLPNESFNPGEGKILVLEDEPLVQDVIEKMLVGLGYEVEVVSDGENAVRRYRECKDASDAFDLLIMDLTIPGGMGGREAIGHILKFDANAKAIVASGYSDDPTMAQYQDAGFVAAIAKPFREADLALIVGKAMRQIHEARLPR